MGKGQKAAVIIGLILVTVLIGIWLGSGGPEEGLVISEFNAANPDAVAISAVPGEGDGDSVYFQITYELKTTGEVGKQEWLYQRNPDTGMWTAKARGLSQRIGIEQESQSSDADAP